MHSMTRTATSVRTGVPSQTPLDTSSSLVSASVSKPPCLIAHNVLIVHLCSLVGTVLLALGILGVTRYIRIRRRRESAAFVPERPPTAMAQREYIAHRHTKSMASTTTSDHHRQKSHGARSRSGSLSVNQTPSPSPLRTAQYARPQSGYEVDRLQYQQPMQHVTYAPISSAASGDVFADYHAPYDGMPRQYAQREEMEYLKDASRRGSTLDFGSHRV